jgi:hypothetical protein
MKIVRFVEKRRLNGICLMKRKLSLYESSVSKKPKKSDFFTHEDRNNDHR